MQSNVCTKSSGGGSRPRPCCRRRRPRRCCFGLCWLLARSRCERWTAGEASTKRHPIRRLTSPHDRLTSSCWRSRQNQFQHKLRRYPMRPTNLVKAVNRVSVLYAAERVYGTGKHHLPLVEKVLRSDKESPR